MTAPAARSTSAPATSPVVFDRVTKGYDGRPVLVDVGFELRAGLVTGLLGPNGAGKSTALRCLLGLARPDSGTVRLLGAPPGQAPGLARRVGVLTDQLGFHPNVTVRRQLEICAAALGLGREPVEPLLARVGLLDRATTRVRGCSTGMRQRLALAAALLPGPELLVLDEPLNGLDPDGIRWMRALVRDFAADGGTVLIASHLLAEIEQTADEVVVLNRSVRYAGPLAELTAAGGRRLEDMYFELLSDSSAEGPTGPAKEVSRA